MIALRIVCVAVSRRVTCPKCTIKVSLSFNHETSFSKQTKLITASINNRTLRKHFSSLPTRHSTGRCLPVTDSRKKYSQLCATEKIKVRVERRSNKYHEVVFSWVSSVVGLTSRKNFFLLSEQLFVYTQIEVIISAASTSNDGYRPTD